MPKPKGVGDRIAQERRLLSVDLWRDIRPLHVAKAIGTTAANVSRWEAGEHAPGDEWLEKLADYYKVRKSWLRYGEEPRRTAIIVRDEPEKEMAPVSTRAGRRAGGRNK